LLICGERNAKGEVETKVTKGVAEAEFIWILTSPRNIYWAL